MARGVSCVCNNREGVIIGGVVGTAEWEFLVGCKRIYTMTCLFAKDHSVDLKTPPEKRNSH